MPVPIICGSQQFCQYVDLFSSVVRKRLHKYFVIVLLAFMICEERRTMTGLLRKILDWCSLSGLSRFFGKWNWDETQLTEIRVKRFHEQLKPWVKTQHLSQLGIRPKKAGRPKPTVVTGYLIMDDSPYGTSLPIISQKGVEWAVLENTGPTRKRDRLQGIVSSRLFSLSDFKERNNLNLRRRYLQGRYGALPSLGSFAE